MPSLTPEELLTCVEAAIRAPSIHNTQPWLFLPVSDGIEVYADLSRRLPAIDPQGRAMHISLGAAVLDLRVALAHLGRQPDTELLPDPANPRHVATVRTDLPGSPGVDDHELYAAIGRRHSNRGPFADVPPQEPALERLRAAARTEGAALHLADAAERDALLSLARTADARRRADPAYRAELRDWTTDDPYREDGVPLEAVGPWSEREAVPIRDMALDREIPGRHAVGFEREPVVAALVTYGLDGPEQWLSCGQALQRVLLEATRCGLAVSLFTQPLEDPELRELLQDHEHLTSVQVALRIGYGQPAAGSPRRPAGEVIVRERPVPVRPPRFG
ncbi:Acg family FMN-binding oxidoreductase [Actinomadura scrupuli]|uniref:Acg family FMN-binding oxidoreductase n=1 Tax=Actinomadura scrupuli TaxID=559629 RepID=UPI003D996196